MNRDTENDDVQLLSIREAASKLCCSVANVYGLIEAGSLAVVQVGKTRGYRIDRRDLEAFIQRRKIRFQARKPVGPGLSLKHIKR